MEGMTRWLKGMAAGMLLWMLWQGVTMDPDTRAFWRATGSHVQAGHLGVGKWDGVPNADPLPDLEPGDIILAHNPGAIWGHFIHAAIYAGEGQVVDTLLKQGVHLGSLQRYRYYTHAAVLKVNLAPEVKRQAVEYARSLVGRPFFLLASRRGEQWFYCTKVVWWAYKQVGIDLDPRGGYWVVPDRLVEHPLVQLVAGG